MISGAGSGCWVIPRSASKIERMLKNLKSRDIPVSSNNMDILLYYDSTDRVAIANGPFFPGDDENMEARYPENESLILDEWNTYYARFYVKRISHILIQQAFRKTFPWTGIMRSIFETM